MIITHHCEQIICVLTHPYGEYVLTSYFNQMSLTSTSYNTICLLTPVNTLIREISKLENASPSSLQMGNINVYQRFSKGKHHITAPFCTFTWTFENFYSCAPLK
ncbi:hypothetical protein POVWA2_015620 [Plasmodium ovale wallikeri]|uniref:Uncharacterized protein n=1 Tax=Plasmodium ovale wallikeri TaxID=864142 RepID=A0A1A8YNS2_PLAOA|nr:hypothetical protein POVWA1_016120 [Plasmodium ovale wallikeri]SBT33598.1 hypothetical protein POVWA2_015620 [Plasmodium ovale wallikeri]